MMYMLNLPSRYVKDLQNEVAELAGAYPEEVGFKIYILSPL